MGEARALPVTAMDVSIGERLRGAGEQSMRLPTQRGQLWLLVGISTLVLILLVVLVILEVRHLGGHL
jgi:hypothetical protein